MIGRLGPDIDTLTANSARQDTDDFYILDIRIEFRVRARPVILEHESSRVAQNGFFLSIIRFPVKLGFMSISPCSVSLAIDLSSTPVECRECFLLSCTPALRTDPSAGLTSL